jgi:precorrin-3B C17-methyltransferase
MTDDEPIKEETQEKRGTLSVVGIGPGSDEHITPKALDAILSADMVIGYTTYIKLVRHLIKDKEIIRTGMTEEIARARAAIEEAQSGKKVTLISSGDAGVYGMCGLVFQVLQEMGWTREQNPELRIIPGISAINSCGSLVGAPLGHDFCGISLSDLLTPWPSIRKKIDCAADADFIIGLYNPASGRRTRQIVEAKEIISKYRPGTTPVALVKSAYRRQQNVVLTDLDNFLDFEIGMNTTVLVGSSQTIVFDGFMVTPRGYTNKYSWDGEIHEGQTAGRTLVVDDPDADEIKEKSAEELMREKRREQRRLKRVKRETGL